jgi:hypothetical protein
LRTGRDAANNLKKWQQVLDFNAQIFQSKQQRGESQWELARTKINDYFPLLALKRSDEVRNLVVSCREEFEHQHDLRNLGMVAGAFAGLEKSLGQLGEARQFRETALRLAYSDGAIEQIAGHHFNLANDIESGGGAWSEVLAHRLAATLINDVVQSGVLDLNRTVLTRNLDQASRKAFPSDFAALCGTLECTDGVRFRELVDRLIEGRMTGDQLLQQVLATIEANSLPGDTQ